MVSHSNRITLSCWGRRPLGNGAAATKLQKCRTFERNVLSSCSRCDQYADGTPYFPLGTALYNWLDGDRDLEIHTLGTLSRNPFNKVRFLIFPKWMVFNCVEPPRFPYLQPQPGKFDLDRFDAAFFAHFESRIRDLQALGIEADIILFHPYDKWGFASMDRAATRPACVTWWRVCRFSEHLVDTRERV
jgi:hypothetical protein